MASIAVNLEPDSRDYPSKPHLSFSQIGMYLRCSMQYYFRYVLGLKQPPKLQISIGKGGHYALEYAGRYKLRTGTDIAVRDVLDKASDFIDLQTEELEDETPTEIGEAKDRALGAIKVYQTRDAPDIYPAAVEVGFDIDLQGDDNYEPIRIVEGRIDLITTDSGVDDYKFVRASKTQLDVDVSPQLTLYARVFQNMTGVLPKRLGYRMFLPGSTRTSPDARAIVRDAALMTEEAQTKRFERLKFQFQQVEKAIRSGIYVPTDNPITCSWCGYRERCQSSLVDDFEAARLRGET